MKRSLATNIDWPSQKGMDYMSNLYASMIEKISPYMHIMDGWLVQCIFLFNSRLLSSFTFVTDNHAEED